MKSRRSIDLSKLTLRQFMTLVTRPPLYQVRDLVERTGLPQPRCSEVLRGIRIYPAGLARVREEVGLAKDEALFDRLLENSAREAEVKGSHGGSDE